MGTLMTVVFALQFNCKISNDCILQHYYKGWVIEYIYINTFISEQLNIGVCVCVYVYSYSTYICFWATTSVNSIFHLQQPI